MVNHLKDNNLGYWEHWWRAMKLSGALFCLLYTPDAADDLPGVGIGGCRIYKNNKKYHNSHSKSYTASSCRQHEQ